ncbi:LysR family transcriptional regulator [Microbacterium sp.]|uniref:LysR family transcriptional regulator n=1 Tax=Microbacterium sp. TaxID=51671 RepID=UPI003A8692BC
MELKRNPHITLRQLWHFVAAAEAGTMSEAARQLHMAPSAISMSIMELERVVGAQLCVKRKSKGITLTPAGRAAFLQASQILDMAGEMVYVPHGDRAQVRGPLSVGCYSPLAPRIVPQMFAIFEERFPLVEVQFVEGYHDDLQAKVLEGSLDLAFLFNLDVLPGLESLPLLKVEPHVLLAESSPLLAKDAVTVADLADQAMLFFDAEPLYGRVLELFRDGGVTPKVRHRTRSYATLRSLIGRDLGAAVVYDNPMLDRSYEGRRVLSRPVSTAHDFSAHIAIMRSRSIRLHARAHAWIESAVEVFADRPATPVPPAP